MTSSTAAAVGGVLPFGAIFVELFFVLSSLWTDKYYYVFGFLLLSFVILVHTCAEITIVLTYFQLCAEDYNWYVSETRKESQARRLEAVGLIHHFRVVLRCAGGGVRSLSRAPAAFTCSCTRRTTSGRVWMWATSSARCCTLATWR